MRKTIYIVLAALGLCLFAGCGSSDKEKVSPLVKQLKDTFGFEVLAVSLDGSSNHHFPDALPDNGVSKLLTNGLGLDRVPALFMVKRDQSASYLVSSGVLSLEDMLSRIQTLALSKPGESLFGGAQAANSVQKTTNFSASDVLADAVATTTAAAPSL